LSFLDLSAVESSVPPAPTLIQNAVIDSSVELICQAPHGYSGLEFKLFKFRNLTQTVQHSSKEQRARFMLMGKDTEKENLYCCQYENSMFSSYMHPGEYYITLYFILSHFPAHKLTCCCKITCISH